MAARRQAGAERGQADRGGAGARARRGRRPAGRGRRGWARGRRGRAAGRRRARRRAGRTTRRAPAQGRGEVERIGAAGRRARPARRARSRRRAGRRRGWRRRRAAPPGPAGSGVTGAGRGRAGRWRCRGTATASARASSRARTAAGSAPEVASSRSATTETPRHGPGRRPAPSTRASRSCGVNRRRAGTDRAGGRVAVLEQGQCLDRVAGDGPGEHGARAVGGREAHLAAGAQGPADLAEGDGGVVDDLEDVVAQRQVVAVAAVPRPGGPRAGGRRRPGGRGPARPTPAVSARRRRVARASALGSTTVTS